MIIILFGAIAPFIIWPIELFLPFPHIIEELAKALLIYLTIKQIGKNSMRIKIAILTGLAFAISESFLYLFNIALVGTPTSLLFRLALTIPLHCLTMLIILFPAMYKRTFIVGGLILSILVHYVFNLTIRSFQFDIIF